MGPLSQYVALLQHLGPRWLLYRATYYLRLKSGMLRRATPIVDWKSIPATELQLHPMDSRHTACPSTWAVAAVAEAEDILQGKYRSAGGLVA